MLDVWILCVGKELCFGSALVQQANSLMELPITFNNIAGLSVGLSGTPLFAWMEGLASLAEIWWPC